MPWASTGRTDERNVTQLLEFMVLCGEVAVAGRKGRDRLWDLASRVYPDHPVVPADEARRIRNERRLGALGIEKTPIEPVDVGDAGEPAVVEGVRGEWIRRYWASLSPGVRRCCHRSTGWCTTASEQ